MKARISEAVSVRRLIPADKKRIFAAFCSAEAVSAWFSPHADIAVQPQTYEFAPGGRFRLRYTMPDGSQPVVGGEFEEIREATRIVFTWIWEAPDPHADIPTRVTVELLTKDRGTEVVITHEQLPREDFCARYRAGWEGTLSRLSRFLNGQNEAFREATNA